jgi:hypothetical protein
MNVVTKRPIVNLQQDDTTYFNDDISSDSEYKIYLTKPIILSDETLSSFDSYLGADGESYLPFDGNKNLETFVDEDGDRYYCSADGENFYNAKGQKLKGFFKKVGGGVVKAGKFVGKNIAKAARWVAKKSKNAVKGVKNLGKNVKAKGKKLVHQKKTKKTNSKISSLSVADASGGDVFTKPLEKASAATPPEKIVDIEGQKYSTEGVEENKAITVSTNPETGEKIAGVEFEPSEVVAVTGDDGYVEYYTPESVGMNKNLKIGLIIGASVIGAALIGFLIYKLVKNK